MKALDAYRDVTHELDKFNTPTFEPEQFNHFFNFAIDEYVANNYARYPLVQKDTDDIRVLIKSTPSPLAITNKRATLPEDYRHILRVQLAGTFNKKVGRFESGDAFTSKKVERRFSNEEGYREDNAYLRASHKSPYFELEGSEIVFDCGPDINLSTTILQYVKVPPTIFLTSDSSQDLSQEIYNTTIDYPSHVYKELVNLCARKFLENIESVRYQTKLNEERLRAQ